MNQTELSNTTPRERLEQRLARTYDRVEDPWEQVQHYRRVMRYVADHPEVGSTAVARATDQPRGRVRPWLEGAVPDAVRAIDVAARKGWLDTAFKTDGSRAINVFVAWVFSGGSILTGTHMPYFALDDELGEQVIAAAFNAADLKYRIGRAEETARATEAVPEIHGSVLGRTLVAWGAPTGTKNADADLTLPSYLADAPEDVRLDFARTYVVNRATARDDLPDIPLQFREDRSSAYIESLVAFFRSLVGDDAVSVDRSQAIFLSAGAADRLYMPPSLV